MCSRTDGMISRRLILFLTKDSIYATSYARRLCLARDRSGGRFGRNLRFPDSHLQGARGNSRTPPGKRSLARPNLTGPLARAERPIGLPRLSYPPLISAPSRQSAEASIAAGARP